MQISVRVKPGSKKGPLIEPNLLDDSLVVYVREQALEGKANKAIIELVAKYYDVPKSRVEIVRGHTSKLKQVKIIEE